MTRPIVALGLALVFVSLLGYTLYALRNSAAQATPLKLSIQGTVKQVGFSNKLDLDVRSNYFTAFPTVRDRGVQSDRVVRLANLGNAAVLVMGMHSLAPLYCLEQRQHGEWSFLPGGKYTSTHFENLSLSPGQSLDFPVIAPEGLEAWRVSLVCRELPNTNKFAVALNRFMSLLGRPPTPKAHIVRTEEVTER